MSLIFVLVVSIASAQQAFTSAGETATSSAGSLTYVVGQMTNQRTDQLHFGVLQVTETTSEVLGISAIDNIDFKVYPNPTTQFLQVQSTSKVPVNLSFMIYDLQGRQVLSGQLSDDKPAINVADLANHQYQLIILKENQPIKTFKIVKQ